jgi:hypothetical protein
MVEAVVEVTTTEVIAEVAEVTTTGLKSDSRQDATKQV